MMRFFAGTVAQRPFQSHPGFQEEKESEAFPQDPVATAIVARIDELFAIDAEARCRGLNMEARHALRQQQSRPLLGEIRKQIEAVRSMALPGGALTKAQLHAHPVGQTHAIPGISRTGVEQ
jgi:Transposase IS66 family